MFLLKSPSTIFRLLRLHQPIGIWLLFLPCLFGIFLALKNLPEIDRPLIGKIIFLFLIGSVAMRSAGCIINDLFDQKIDEKVTRTKNRPLAAKEISRLNALTLLGLLLIFGLSILLQFNWRVIIGGFLALILVIVYPLMKRITYYPQIFLGLVFNSGILLSSLAILNKITFTSLVLYFASIIWTVIYDTIYAYQDIEDDLRIGVKSSAIKFSKNPKKILIALSTVMFLTLFWLGLISQFKLAFFLIISASIALLIYKIQKLNFKNSNECLAVFKFNLWVGALILAAIIEG